MEQTLHDYLTEGSKYTGSPVQYIDYIIETMIESVVKLIYHPFLRNDLSSRDAMEIKFKDKAVEVSGQMYDNFRPL